MRQFLFIIWVMILHKGCIGQTPNSFDSVLKVGGPCEGCEAIYEYGKRVLGPAVTLAGYQENEPKLHINGTIYHQDGSPAEGVILYLYHTNRQGIYKNETNESGWGLRHGSTRGWIKTGPDGKYEIHTFRPASYPGRSEPEHIHMTIKEPGYTEYYIDDILFDDDPLLTAEKRASLRNRAGSGLVVPELKNGILIVSRDIILGKNIPSYQ